MIKAYGLTMIFEGGCQSCPMYCGHTRRCQALNEKVEWRFKVSKKAVDENGTPVVVGITFDPTADRLPNCPLAIVDIDECEEEKPKKRRRKSNG
jgi:hypothetical protein